MQESALPATFFSTKKILLSALYHPYSGQFQSYISQVLYENYAYALEHEMSLVCFALF